VPSDRFERDDDGTGLTRGGLVHDVRGFDAAFFGISSLEASAMDPQHRMLLEVAWHAFEHAGLTPERLRGVRGAVIIGMGHSDYARLALADVDRLSAYSAAGIALSVGVNRVSQLFDLRGPSLALDTGCSSSLSAFHSACTSLIHGESDLALAGGVSAVLLPDGADALAQAWLLSESGACKSFDAEADGYVRSDGCGLVVLKRLSDALRDGDNVLAVIRGSALGHDGQRDSLTTPRAAQQAALMREALAHAQLEPAAIDYVEAHGVGSPASDSAEIAALAEVFGHDPARTEHCWFGSVKTNLGHLEWASGAASLIKLVLALESGEIPASLHFSTPNPALAEAGRLRVVDAHASWPRPAGHAQPPRRALVHAFGLAGTNCDLVLEQAPPARPSVAPESAGPELLVLSAQTEPALRALAAAHATALEALPQAQLADYATASLQQRAALRQRLALLATAPALAASALRDFAAGNGALGLVAARAQEQRVVFLFSGQGSQYPGMIEALYRSEPEVRRALDRCDEVLRGPLGRSLISVVFPCEAERALIDDTAYTQPALFAVEYALAMLWQSRGVRPAAVLGHSIGEYVAACVAGVMSLESALHLVAERGRLLSSLPRNGAMAAVFCEPDEIADLLEAHPTSVSIAAYNAPGNMVISGARGAIEAILEQLEERFVVSQPLRVSHAFHSALLDPILERFREFASAFNFRAPNLPLASNVSGQLLLPGQVQDARYWTDHLRGAVRYADGIKALASAGFDTFLEVGPGDSMVKLGAKSLPGAGATWLASVRRGKSERESWLSSAASLFVRGAELKPAPSETPRAHVTLPSYPFQRQSYWVVPETLRPARAPTPSESATPVRAALPPMAGSVRGSLHAELTLLLGADKARALDPQLGLFAQGLDSLGSIALHKRLEQLGGRSLPSSFLFDHPTLDAICAALSPTLPSAERAGGRAPAPREAGAEHEPIAIVSMACRFPGADDPERLWQLLRDGRDAVGEVPAQRWQVDAFYSADPDAAGKTYARHGGYLAQIEQFDHQFFGISPREAAAIDPQQRLLLELSWEALERAGQPVEQLSNSATGVFVGAINNEYLQRLIKANDPTLLDAFTGVGNLGSAIAGRISYSLGLRGPSLSLDTACSSSLVAVHLAVRSLRSGESRLALAGGVNLLLEPDGNVFLSRARALASDGRCKTFDASADGYVRAEGAGILVLKRLCDALADGDPICAVIRGSAVNHNGHTSGFTVPSSSAQSELLRAALHDADTEAAHIDCVEVHGTGTALGDPIEFAALAQVFGTQREQARPLYLGSVKTNLGHLEAAAGVAGLIKLALALTHKQMPAHLHLREVNPRIDLDALGAVVPNALTPWPRGTAPRLGGVSSFGMSGTNAHVILEEAPGAARATAELAPGLPFVLALSARGQAALVAQAESLATFLEHERTIDLADVCYTAALRRTHLSSRAIVSGRSREALIDELTQLARGTSSASWPESVAPLLRGYLAGEHSNLSALFVRSGAVVALPTYAWQRVRCWLELGQTPAEPRQSARPSSAAPSSARQTAPDEWLMALDWQPKSAEAREDTPETRWLVLGAQGELSRAIVRLLENRARHCVYVEPAAHFERKTSAHYALRVDHEPDLRRLSSECGEPFHHVVNLLALGAPELGAPEDAADRLSQAQRLTCDASRVLLRCLGGPDAPRISCVTQGALPSTPACNVSLSQSLSWGLGRSLLHEQPELRLKLVDLDTHSSAKVLAKRLLEELESGDLEPQVALHAAARRVARLVRHTHAAAEPRQASAPALTYALETARPGFLSDVRLRACTRRPPGPREIEIEVQACGLSFLDAMRATALLPDTSDAPAALGLEVTGLVSAVGSEVRDLEPGDAVIALCPEGARSHVCVPRVFALRRPAGLAPQAAASLPLAFVLARYALLRRAGLRAGERVLIHSATGAVGLAAIEVARAVGAEVYASAGDDTRRDYLRSIGVQHVFDSRLTSWPDELRQLTQGEGVDVILSSIAGDLGRPERAPLRSEGRFIALGLREPVSAHELGDNHSLLRIDLHALLRAESPSVIALLSELERELAEARVSIPPLRNFSSSSLPSALRGLAQAIGIGKVTVTLDATARDIRQVDAALELPRFAPDAAYVVSGALGGLGLGLVRFLVEHGARRLLLLGRSAPSAAASTALDELRRAGCTLRYQRVDVARADELAQALHDARAELGSLRGVFHVAGVLDDAPLDELDPERFARVLSPKALGAYQLHALTQHDPLEHFVLFSSAASLIGNPGQANYAAANAFLDNLATLRRAQGRCGLSLNWGPWAEVGMAASAELNQSLARRGVGAIEPSQGFTLLAQLLAQPSAQVGILPIQWSRFTPHLAPLLRTSLFAHLSGVSEDFAGSAASQALPSDPHERARALTQLLRREAASVLGVEPAQIDPARSLLELGLDSLGAVELKGRANAHGVQLSLPRLLAGDSLEQALAPEAPRSQISALRPRRDESLVRWSDSARAEFDLVCFPYAGGGASVFRDWAADLPASIALSAIQLPGRGVRLHETPHTRLASLLDELVPALASLTRPTVFFGHCMGALVMSEVARRLMASGKAPLHLFVSASPAPQRYAVPRLQPATRRYVNASQLADSALVPVHQLDDAQLFEVLRFLNFAPTRALLDSPELAASILPTVRADFAVCDTYAYDARLGLLDMPISIFGGTEDPFATEAEVSAWRAETRARSTLQIRPGDHYFLVEERRFITDHISAVLATAQRRCG
jgi:acyl transferase domain-containing protein/surfactin synthase thioesterase subunit